MGTGFRIFFFDDDDSLQRFPVARYQRLRRGELDERLPKYAGKRVRCAMVVLETAGRRPIAISHIDYSILTFDPQGQIDTAELEKAARLALDALGPYGNGGSSEHVIDARSRFARKRLEREFKWTPTPDIQAAIVNAIFEKEPA